MKPNWLYVVDGKFRTLLNLNLYIMNEKLKIEELRKELIDFRRHTKKNRVSYNYSEEGVVDYYLKSIKE